VTFIYKHLPGFAAAWIAAAGVSGPGTAGAAELVLGVPIPKKAMPAGPYRYESLGSLRDVVKFFKKKLKRIPHVVLDAIDHPEVKVVHIKSTSPSTAWEGINLSLYRRRVSIFVIPRGGAAGREARTGDDEAR
jgi:hypothetical protein